MDVLVEIRITKEYDIHPVPPERGVQLFFYDDEEKLVLFIECMRGKNIRINQERYYYEPNDLHDIFIDLYNFFIPTRKRRNSRGIS